MTLKEYIKQKHDEWPSTEELWQSEGIVWAVEEYHSSMGELTDDDKETLRNNGLIELADYLENN